MGRKRRYVSDDDGQTHDVDASAPADRQLEQIAGDAELERDADGTVTASRHGRRADYIAAAVAGAFPAVPPGTRERAGAADPGVPAESFRARAARYAEWRWDAFHRGEVGSL